MLMIDDGRDDRHLVLSNHPGVVQKATVVHLRVVLGLKFDVPVIDFFARLKLVDEIHGATNILKLDGVCREKLRGLSTPPTSQPTGALVTLLSMACPLF